MSADTILRIIAAVILTAILIHAVVTIRRLKERNRMLEIERDAAQLHLADVTAIYLKELNKISKERKEDLS